MSKAEFERPDAFNQMLETFLSSVRTRIFESTGASYPAWRYAADVLRRIQELAKNGLDNIDLIDFLAWLNYYHRKDFTTRWSKLTDEQKRAVLNTIIHEFAQRGLSSLLGEIAYDVALLVNSVLLGHRELENLAKEVKEQVLKASMDFINGKTDFNSIMKAIAPLYNESADGKRKLEDGVFLASFLDTQELKELVKESLLDNLKSWFDYMMIAKKK